MNRKQTLILLVILLAVGGLGYWAFKNRSSRFEGGSRNAGKNLLPNLPVNDITHIRIKDATNELNLVKGEDTWRVQERKNYPASFDEISGFLLKAKDVKVIQSEQVGPSQHARLELIEPGKGDKVGTLVELKDKSGKTVQTMILGKMHLRKSDQPSPFGGEGGFPDGRFILLPSDPNHVAVVSETFSDVVAKPANWLNKDFFKIEKPKTISLTYTNATNSWKIIRESETNDWKLAEAKAEEQLDNNKASGVANALASPTFNDILSNSTNKLPTVALFETFDGFTYTIKIGKATADDNYPLSVNVAANLVTARTAPADEKPEDKEKKDKEFQDRKKQLEEKLANEKKFEGHVFLVSKWTLDSLLKNRGELLVEKKEEEKKPAEENAEAPLVPPTP